jgi:hypothetical protein
MTLTAHNDIHTHIFYLTEEELSAAAQSLGIRITDYKATVTRLEFNLHRAETTAAVRCQRNSDVLIENQNNSIVFYPIAGTSLSEIARIFEQNF